MKAAKSKTISKSSNVSKECDESDNDLYAAARLYRRNAKVKAIPVKEIKNFNRTIKKFPYDAQILISESKEGKTYEVGSVLVDRESLEKNYGKRYTKVNKRRSDVDYNLKEQERKNQKALKEQEKSNQKPLKEIGNLKIKSKKTSVKRANRSSLSTTNFHTEKIDVLNQNKLTFEPESFGGTLFNEVEKKNEEIERLKEEIELLKKPSTSYLSPSSVSTKRAPLTNLTRIENILESAASSNYPYIGIIYTPSGSGKTTSKKSFPNLVPPVISLKPTPSDLAKVRNSKSLTLYKNNDKMTTPSNSDKVTKTLSLTKIISPLMGETPTPSGPSFRNNDMINTPSGSVKVTLRKSAKRTIRYTSDSSIENEKEYTSTNGKKINKMKRSKKAKSDVDNSNDDTNSDDEKTKKNRLEGNT
ncbi:hypothetical protein TKK_0013871 [Trichogramma kaykai]|uniref:Uncharacterized protein n=1 Tax=Trichogramma kaykai TaxID=54128 RepID=A0ABD2WH34_9HYME